MSRVGLKPQNKFAEILVYKWQIRPQNSKWLTSSWSELIAQRDSLCISLYYICAPIILHVGQTGCQVLNTFVTTPVEPLCHTYLQNRYQFVQINSVIKYVKFDAMETAPDKNSALTLLIKFETDLGPHL